MVRPRRLERPARGLGNRCSIHLSYGRICIFTANCRRGNCSIHNFSCQEVDNTQAFLLIHKAKRAFYAIIPLFSLHLSTKTPVLCITLWITHEFCTTRPEVLFPYLRAIQPKVIPIIPRSNFFCIKASLSAGILQST